MIDSGIEEPQLGDPRWAIVGRIPVSSLIRVAVATLRRTWQIVEAPDGTRALIVEDPDEPYHRPAKILAAMYGRAALLDFDEYYPTVHEYVAKRDGSPVIAIDCTYFDADHSKPIPTLAYLERVGLGITDRWPTIIASSRQLPPPPWPKLVGVVIAEVPPERILAETTNPLFEVERHPRGFLRRTRAEFTGYARRFDTTTYHLLRNVDAPDEFWCWLERNGCRSQLFTTTAAVIHPSEDFDLVDSILGASTPLDICRALDIPPEYLEPPG